MKKIIHHIWTLLRRPVKSEQTSSPEKKGKSSTPDPSTRKHSGKAERPPRRKSRKKSADVDGVTGAKASAGKAVPEAPWDLSRFEVPSVEGKIRFHDLDLPLPMMHAICDTGFQYCTPIQAEIMPSTLKGRDAFGRAQTGTGKTAAFLITIISRLKSDAEASQRKNGTPRALILAPTRELVLQITAEAMELAKYHNLKIM